MANARVIEFIKKQSMSCQANRDAPNEDLFTAFLNGLCPWIYYDEDDSDKEEEEKLVACSNFYFDFLKGF